MKRLEDKQDKPRYRSFTSLIDKNLITREDVDRLTERYNAKSNKKVVDNFIRYSSLNPNVPEYNNLKTQFQAFDNSNIDSQQLKNYNNALTNYNNKLGTPPTSSQNNQQFVAPTPPERNEASRQLGLFTINALSKLPESIAPNSLTKENKFRGIKADTVANNERYLREEYNRLNAVYDHNKELFPKNNVGNFNPYLNQILLNVEHPNIDVMDLISHEGNHAIDYNNPYIADSVINFLNKKFNKKGIPLNERGILPKGYLENLYKGMQDIINIERFSPTSTYKLSKDIQTNQDVNLSKLNSMQKRDLTTYFPEVPAHALEGMVGYNHPWKINEETNSDSRKLLRRLMKDTHQKYINYGLQDITQPTKDIESYRYNQNPIIKHKIPDEYLNLNKNFSELIAALQNPNRKSVGNFSPKEILETQNELLNLSPNEIEGGDQPFYKDNNSSNQNLQLNPNNQPQPGQNSQQQPGNLGNAFFGLLNNQNPKGLGEKSGGYIHAAEGGGINSSPQTLDFFNPSLNDYNTSERSPYIEGSNYPYSSPMNGSIKEQQLYPLETNVSTRFLNSMSPNLYNKGGRVNYKGGGFASILGTLGSHAIMPGIGGVLGALLGGGKDEEEVDPAIAQLMMELEQQGEEVDPMSLAALLEKGEDMDDHKKLRRKIFRILN